MKSITNSLIIMLFMLTIVNGDNLSKVILNVNGHEHELPNKILDKVDEVWASNRSSFADSMVGKTIKFKLLNITFKAKIKGVALGNEINRIKFKKGNNNKEGVLTAIINNCYIRADWNAKINLLLWRPSIDKEITTEADFKIKLNTSLEFGDSLDLHMITSGGSFEASDWDFRDVVPDWLMPITSNVIDWFIGVLANAFKLTISGSLNELDGMDFEVFKLPSFDLDDFVGNAQELNSETERMFESLPFEYSFDFINLKVLNTLYNIMYIKVDFLHRYKQDFGSYLDFEGRPDSTFSNSLQYAGFSDLHWSDYEYLSPGSDLFTQFDTLISRTEEMGLNQIRLDATWNEIWPEISDTNISMPITSTLVDSYIDSINSWNGFDTLDTLLQKIEASTLSRTLLSIGLGQGKRTPRYDGKLIVPGKAYGEDSTEYVSVSEEVYLYWLELYARCVVREYKNRIVYWQAENELNAARFGELFDYWRKGDAWRDDSINGFQTSVLEVLHDAIIEEDSQDGKVVVTFHIFNSAKRLHEWIDYYDIAGLHFYPNQVTDEPNLGFMIGEYVWAARRMVKSQKVCKKQKGYAAIS